MGKIALIKSDTLRSKLYNFVKSVEETQKFETLDIDDINSYFVPFLYENINFRDMDGTFSNYKEGIGVI
ncbi:MAG: hypothetical protein HC798_00140 [Polaribacter sp.]|nr:hypothetical protein [Polaribacter sp.]